MGPTLKAQELLAIDPKLGVIPTFGCVYCARNTGCYECRGHGIIGVNTEATIGMHLEACRSCLSACTSCAFLRNMLLKLVRGKN